MESQDPEYLIPDLSQLSADHGLRIKITRYHPNDRDRVRRAYLQKGPCKPYGYKFKQRKIGNLSRCFNPKWYDDDKNWLEYSVEKEAIFCLCCYLFKSDVGKQAGGDNFVTEGFDCWNKKDRLDAHVGGPNSAHNQAWRRCQDLMKQDHHVDVVLNKNSELMKKEYRTRLSASVDYLRYLLR